MKKISLLVVVIGVLLMLFSTAYAYPGSITIDSQHNSGNDYTFGFEMFFETGEYEFSVGSGAWNDRDFFFDSWVWSANIYRLNTGEEYMLGDDTKHYSGTLAFNEHKNDAPVSIVINNLAGENLMFYIKSDSEFNNRSSVTMNVDEIVGVTVVPEPVSSMLFVIGGLVFAGRRYFKKNGMKSIKLPLLLLLLVVSLTACGSGGGSSSDNGNNDQCVSDPDKTEPGICGCGVADTDSDGDGTADCNDSCENDPNKTNAGICGCGIADTDTDEDGTPDCNDNCQAGTDSDGDLVDDCDEQCKNDPDKTDAGICGCSVPDTDSDGDGTVDCNETCDDDPNKTVPGICDCGTPDTDSDNDGTADCIDECDDDPDKTTPGTCGCGVADDDSDADGVLDCLEPHYVAVGDNGTIVSSIDGITWELQRTKDDGEKINDVASGSWIGVGQEADNWDANGAIAVVDDAFNVSPEVLDPARELNGIANGGDGVWIAVGVDRPMLYPVLAKTSDDGTNWTYENMKIMVNETLVVKEFALYEIATDKDSNWIAVGVDNKALVSISNDNGENWAVDNVNTVVALYGIAYNDNETMRWIAVGEDGGIVVSDNIGVDWMDKSLTGTPTLVDIANDGDSNWVAVGVDGTVAVSSDNGNSWSSFTIDTEGRDFNGVTYGNGLWISVGSDGVLGYSANNGIQGSWVPVTGLTAENLRSVAYKQ